MSAGLHDSLLWTRDPTMPQRSEKGTAASVHACQRGPSC